MIPRWLLFFCTWRTSAKERFGLSALLMGKHPGPMQQGQRPTMSERSRPTATSRPYRSSLGSHPPPLSPILSFPFALAFALPLVFDAGSPTPSLAAILLELLHSRLYNEFLPSGTGFHCILEPLVAHHLKLAFALSTLVCCLLPFCNHQQRTCNLRVCPHACLKCIRNPSRTTTIHTPPMHERLPLRSNDTSEGTAHNFHCAPEPAIQTHS